MSTAAPEPPSEHPSPPTKLTAPVLPYVTEIPWADDFVRRPLTSVPFLTIAIGTVISNDLALWAAVVWIDPARYSESCCGGFLVTPIAGAFLASTLLIVSQIIHGWVRGGGYFRRGENHYFIAGLAFGLCLSGCIVLLEEIQLIHPDFAAFRTAGAIAILLLVPVVGPFFLIYRPRRIERA